ncbi:MAG: cyanophycinase [Fimbriimonadaceae bacterium]|nr:cyanophycinase [Fimbriimonadaceae bacterium]
MRRFVGLLLIAVAAFASQPSDRPQWPQPIVNGALVLGEGAGAREAFLARCGPGAKLLVYTSAPALDKPWSDVGATRAEGRPDLAAFRGVWIEPGTALLPDAYARISQAKAGGTVVGGGLDLAIGGSLAEGAAWVTRWNGDESALHAAAAPGRFAVGVPKGAAVQLDGRTLTASETLGIAFAAGPGGKASVEPLPAGAKADWIALRRRAIERTLPPFPPAVMPRPNVPRGTLFIVGGGGMPDGLLEQFIEAAGGADAPIVFVPCEFAETIPEPAFVGVLRRAGAKDVTWIHTKDRSKADTDPTILDKLRRAKGIWFGGGRQWNFVDSYLDTEAHRLMLDVLARGGAIGGSSAGASIQTQFMPRGDPLGNTNIIAPGYERGLGFLPGCAVDQHFTQRSRHKDMTTLMKAYPQVLGIGIDEATALVVRGSVAEVVGRGHVFVYDRRKPGPAEGPDYEELKAGARYELAERRTLREGGGFTQRTP